MITSRTRRVFGLFGRRWRVHLLAAIDWGFCHEAAGVNGWRCGGLATG